MNSYQEWDALKSHFFRLPPGSKFRLIPADRTAAVETPDGEKFILAADGTRSPLPVSENQIMDGKFVHFADCKCNACSALVGPRQ